MENHQDIPKVAFFVSAKDSIDEVSRDMEELVDLCVDEMWAPLKAYNTLAELSCLQLRKCYLDRQLITDCLKDILLGDADRALYKDGKFIQVQNVIKSLIDDTLESLPPLSESDYRLFGGLLCQDGWLGGGDEYCCIINKSDSDWIHDLAIGRRSDFSDLKKTSLGLAGRFSRTLFIKADIGFTVVAEISTSNLFTSEVSVQMGNTKLATERIAKILVEAESKSVQIPNPIFITISLFKDNRFPDILARSYPEALMNVICIYFSSLGHKIVLKKEALVYKENRDIECLTLKTIFESIQPIKSCNLKPTNWRLEMEYLRIMGYPSFSTTKITGYWSYKHLLRPLNLRYRFAEALLRNFE